jgi:maleylpyruvate isomerase
MAMTPDIALVLEDCRSAGMTLCEAIAGVGDDFVRAPSRLPGWSRGHVLAHMVNAGDGVARQVEYAARGELIEFYDGGRDGRNAAIEADAKLPASAHQERVGRVIGRLSRTWPEIGSPLWDQRVAYRDGTVVDVALTWWRELRIHLVDLDAGVGADTWSEEFCWHLFDFLAPRLPADMNVDLRPDGLEPWQAPDASSQSSIVVRGGVRDIAMWLAGRTPDQLPVAHAGGKQRILPALNPWPSAR